MLDVYDDDDVYRYSCNVPVILSDFNGTSNCLGRFSKNPGVLTSMKIRTVGAELFHADRQT